MILNGKPKRLIKTENDIILSIEDQLYTITKNNITKENELNETFDIPKLHELLDIHTHNDKTYILTFSNNTYFIYVENALLHSVDNVTSYCFYEGCMYYIKSDVFCYCMGNNKLIKINMNQTVKIISCNGNIVFCDNNKIYIASLNLENNIEEFNINNNENSNILEKNNADNTDEKNSLFYRNIDIISSYHTHNSTIQKLYTTSKNIYSVCTEKIVRYSTITKDKEIIHKHNNDFIDIKDDTTHIYILFKTNLIFYEKATKNKIMCLILNEDVKYLGNIFLKNFDKNCIFNDDKDGNLNKDIFELKNEDTKQNIIAYEHSANDNERMLSVLKDDYTIYFISNDKLIRHFKFTTKYEDCFMHNNDLFLYKGNVKRGKNKILHYKIENDKLTYYNILNLNINNITAILYKENYYIKSGNEVIVLLKSGMMSMQYDNVVDLCLCDDRVIIAYHDEILTIPKDEISKYKIEGEILQIKNLTSELYILTKKGLQIYKDKYVISGCFYKFAITDDFFILVDMEKISYYDHSYVLVRCVEIDFKIIDIVNESLVLDEDYIYRNI